MGTFRKQHNPVLLQDVDLLKWQVQRDIFDGNESPTRVVLQSISGTIDPFTEEITHHEATTYFNASGIIGHVAENDVLLGVNGRVVIGDLSVVYHYDVISGVFLQNKLRQIQVNVPAASGLYHVAGHMVETFANKPIYVKVALKLDANG